MLNATGAAGPVRSRAVSLAHTPGIASLATLIAVPTFNDALVFDVACLAHVAAAKANPAHGLTAPPPPEAVAAAIELLVTERDGIDAASVHLQLATAAVHLYASSHVATPRRTIFSLAHRHAPQELSDLPLKLDGASTSQLLDVAMLLEQAFGTRADALLGASDAFANLLARSEALQRENDELRRQVDHFIISAGVADVLHANHALVSSLYQALAVADAAKLVPRTKYEDETELRKRELVETGSQCRLLTSSAHADSAAAHSNATEVAELRARIAKLERFTSDAVRSAEERASVAEAQVVALQKKLLAMKTAQAAGAAPPQPAPVAATPAAPRAVTHSHAEVQAGMTSLGIDLSNADAALLVQTHAAKEAAWAEERRRLLTKLQFAADMLSAQSRTPPNQSEFASPRPKPQTPVAVTPTPSSYSPAASRSHVAAVPTAVPKLTFATPRHITRMMKSGVDTAAAVAAASPATPLATPKDDLPAGLRLSLPHRFLRAAKALCEARKSVSFILEIDPSITFDAGRESVGGETAGTLVERARRCEDRRSPLVSITMRCGGVGSDATDGVDVLLRCLVPRGTMRGLSAAHFTLFSRLLTAGLALGDGRPHAQYSLLLPTGGDCASIIVEDDQRYTAVASFPLCESATDVWSMPFVHSSRSPAVASGAAVAASLFTAVRRVKELSSASWSPVWQCAFASARVTLSSEAVLDIDAGDVMSAKSSFEWKRLQGGESTSSHTATSPLKQALRPSPMTCARLPRGAFEALCSGLAELGVRREDATVPHPEGRESESLAPVAISVYEHEMIATACATDGLTMLSVAAPAV